MTTFVALYRGPSVAAARLVAVSADPSLVAEVASQLLQAPETDADPDPVLSDLATVRRRGVRQILREVE